MDQAGKARDGLPRDKNYTMQSMQVSPHTHRNDLVKGMHPKWERRNPNNLVGIRGRRDIVVEPSVSSTQ